MSKITLSLLIICILQLIGKLTIESACLTYIIVWCVSFAAGGILRVIKAALEKEDEE